jgi:hypothetical protein
VRLFHFSEDPAIAHFDPRPVRVPVERPSGKEWLSGPLVWAIDEAHGFLYLFPRECPRVLLWPTPATTEADRERWLAGSTSRAVRRPKPPSRSAINIRLLTKYFETQSM